MPRGTSSRSTSLLLQRTTLLLQRSTLLLQRSTLLLQRTTRPLRRPPLVLASPILLMAVLLAPALLGACRSTPAPTTAASDGKVALPPADGAPRHTLRLAWSAWRPDGSFGTCGRRTHDLGLRGRLGRCVVVAAPGASPERRDWTTDPAFVRDGTPVDNAPGRCRVLVEDNPGTLAGPPARATLVGPGGRRPLGEWLPAAEIDGDYFALEPSFSPDGRFVAVQRIAVGRGEGEQLVEVIAVEVRPAPACP